MTGRERMLTALDLGKPDRLPVTTHGVMGSYLQKYCDGMSGSEFYDHFGFDHVVKTFVLTPDAARGEYFDAQGRVVSDRWRIEDEAVPHPRYKTMRHKIVTPKKTLSVVCQSNEHTTWCLEHLVKEKNDIDIIREFMTRPSCDREAVNRFAAKHRDKSLIRSWAPCFEFYGQPGCWQDAACLYGTEALIMETFDDAAWVHELLTILRERKMAYISSLTGVEFDLLEIGGGDASSTVISPKIFDEFVAPYDRELICVGRACGQRFAYHTCGGMMEILENIAALEPHAMETFTPPEMGGDARLAEAKRRVGDKVCMTGGFDQFHFFTGCTPEDTRREVRRCFREAGEGGGYILCPSDHFFEAESELVAAFVDEARKCVY